MNSLVEAVEFVQMIEKRLSVKVSTLEEIAYHDNWIDKQMLLISAENMENHLVENILSRLYKGRLETMEVIQ